MKDCSNGYEENAEDYIRRRNPLIGAEAVRNWAREFRPDAEVLELGCGHGAISAVLVEEGVKLLAVDASPTLLAAFQNRFPAIETDCSSAESSRFFDRLFDGIVAWGLIFLLDESTQREVLLKAAGALRPNGRLLFTAPRDPIEWVDVMTRLPSRSLGTVEYERILSDAGLRMSPAITDEGDNYYFFAAKDRPEVRLKAER